MTSSNATGPGGTEIALEARDTIGTRMFSPSVARNKGPILEAWRALMPHDGHILEVGAGTGEHGATLAAAHPQLRWQPSDPDPNSRESIAAWAQTVPDGRMMGPLPLAVDQPDWWRAAAIPAGITTMVSINMIHIAPWAAAEGLFSGAAALLPPGGNLFLYGPFKRCGITAPSNERFDADLKRRNPSWGVRDLDDALIPLARGHDLSLGPVRDMPANNLCAIFQKT